MLHNTSFRMIIALLHFYTNTKMRLLKSYTYDGTALKIYTYGIEKLEWCGYPMVKTFDDMYNCFDRTPACGGQTDRQISCHSTVRAMHTLRTVKTGMSLTEF